MIISTYPDKANAEKIARESIKARLIACVNITKVRSIYIWNGNIEEVDEFLVLFKTTKKGADVLRDFIRKNHPYEVPEIVEIAPQYVDPKYLQWLTENVDFR
ncbi:MAG: divalent-cation tolerance protein CutA [Candidatus Methylarchaceae archaeon HK01B]|nr:divalent-cation tolerance protein CutA [Candidatus Methylarchaceae archaeon HK01M]MCP8318990.1 divalent-cation tolerance protein CutA [Candidatus Methylarchaceae archaeon HK01B]